MGVVGLAAYASRCRGPARQAPVQLAALPHKAVAARKNLEVVNAILSHHPPIIKHKDWVQVDSGGVNGCPYVPLLYLYSALKRYPKATRIQASWGDAIFTRSIEGAATYNRRTKMLWYRQSISGEQPVHFYAVYKGVSIQMLYQAGVEEIARMGDNDNSGDNDFMHSDEQGCERVALYDDSRRFQQAPQQNASR